MWTPKRVLILMGSSLLFLAGYAVYSYFLGGLDNLPPLPPEMLPRADIQPGLDTTGGEIELKLQQAFGPGCEELRRPMTLLLRDKGMVLAAGQVDPKEPDGRVKMYPFSVAIFPKGKIEGFPEINTVQCEVAYLTLDRPVNNSMEISNRKVIAIELRGRDIILVNNRKTPQKNDDLEVRISRPQLRPDEEIKASLYYEEAKHLIETADYVKLLDTQTQPNPTEITAWGMKLHLAKEPAADKKQDKGENSGPVELLELLSNVEMHLWVDADSGFLAGPQDFKKPEPARGAKAPPVEKSQVVIKTAGKFTYDLKTELAIFEGPREGELVAPGEVVVSREHKLGTGKKYDQLVCDRLEMQFRKKVGASSPRDSSTGGKEIETALATSRKEVVLTMDTENLEAYGSELFYRAGEPNKGPQTILKGNPMHAAKEGHKIEALELHLIGAHGKDGQGQEAHAKGPGRIDLFEKGNVKNPWPVYVLFQDHMTSIKDREGEQFFDLLTFVGDAAFIDEERQQRLHGDQLQVWLQQNQASADVPTAPGAQGSTASKQKLHRVVAQGHVRAFTPEMNIRQTNRLTISFLPEVATGDKLPEVAAVTTSQRPAELPSAPGPVTPVAPAPVTPVAPQATPALLPPQEEKKEKKKDKPIELTAEEVVMYVSTLGTKKQLQEMKAEGNVYVMQEGDLPSEKAVEIQGQLLNLLHHPLGDTLFVYGETGKWGRLELGKLKLLGPKIVVNQKDNIAEVDGQGAMTLPPSEKNFDGSAPTKTAPGQPETRLTIYWNKSMIFRGKDADFYGGVQAEQDNSRLRCEDMSVTFDRFVSLKEGQKGGQGAKVDQVLCTLKVFAVDAKKEGDRYTQATIVEGTQLHSINPDGLTHVSGPGRVRHLDLGASSLAAETKPAPPGTRQDEVLKLTRIEFEQRMSSKNLPSGKTATFYGNIKVYHFPANSLDATMDRDHPPKNGFYLQSELLNAQTRPIGNRSYQVMVAERKVFFRTEDKYGYCDVLTYDESTELIILKANEGNQVQLFDQPVQGRTPKRVTGKTIIYNRRTNEFKVGDGTEFQSRLEPRPSLRRAWIDADREDEPFGRCGPVARHQRDELAADGAVDDLALARGGDGHDHLVVLVHTLLDDDLRFLAVEEREFSLLVGVERLA